MATPKPIVESDTSKINVPVAWGAIAFIAVAFVSLASLHVLSPGFDPSYRMISEYALGNYGWVLSLMFFTWGASSWLVAFAIWSQLKTKAGKVGLWFLLVAGFGTMMASVFDIRQDVGHSIAGFLGVGGMPVAALLISKSLGRTKAWLASKKPLMWLAHLTWISVVLLIVSLVIMTMQFMQIYGNNLPQQAPATLPAGVIGLVGWADRLIVVAAWLWVTFVAWQAIKLNQKKI